MMKVQVVKFAAATAILVILTMVAQAQLLKPGEIVYSRAATVDGGNCDTAAVWAVGLDGANDRRITGGFHPRISPDGRKILFKRQAANVSCNPFGGFIQWWIRDLASGVETAISGQQGYSFGHAFSPETNRADRQITTNEGGTFCQMNTDGANRICFSSELAPIRGVLHLSVRGGDSLIVLQNSDPGTPQSGLWTLSYDRTNKQKIPNTSINDWTPDWSNDGQTIAYARSAGEFGTGGGRGAFYPYYLDNLFTVKPDGSNFTPLTFFTNLPQADGFSFSLVWTLDNQTILDAARLNNVAGIYKFAADGSGIQGRIPITPGAIPDWVGGIVPAYGEKQIASWGGGIMANGGYSLVDTIGQAFAGQTSTGGNFNLQSGFWTADNSAAKFDFDGDGKADVSVFRPSNGTWYLQQSSAGFTGAAFGFGTDKIVPADYDGDGKTDLAVFRGGTWYLQRSSQGFTGAAFGAADDIPVPADYDGDGRADIAVFRPSNGTWYLQQSSNGFTGIAFGQSGDRPVAADYDSDGKADIAVYRGGFWYILRSQLGFTGVQFGTATDIPTVGDYDGDGKADEAVYRGGTWYLLQSAAGFAGVQFGVASDVPTAADYDGDGKTDIAVYRAGTWYLQRSTAGFTGVVFGDGSNKPIPNAFVP